MGSVVLNGLISWALGVGILDRDNNFCDFQTYICLYLPITIYLMTCETKPGARWSSDSGVLLKISRLIASGNRIVDLDWLVGLGRGWLRIL